MEAKLIGGMMVSECCGAECVAETVSVVRFQVVTGGTGSLCGESPSGRSSRNDGHKYECSSSRIICSRCRAEVENAFALYEHFDGDIEGFLANLPEWEERKNVTRPTPSITMAQIAASYPSTADHVVESLMERKRFEIGGG